MNVLKPEKKIAVLSALLEGCSIRATSRMTGCHKTTIMRVLNDIGARCQAELDERLRNVECEAVECDELWSFIWKKEAMLTDEDKEQNPEYGDAYTFVAFEPDSKAVIGFHVGKRTADNTHRFIWDLSRRLLGKPQISTDGFTPYITAIEHAFGADAHYAMIVKTFSAENPGGSRYRPPKISGVQITKISGNPKRRACTSYVERNNWTIRTHLRRFTRLSNGFSRKLNNMKVALALWFWYYNFCRIHGSTRITPAMALGVTDRVWDLAEIVA